MEHVESKLGNDMKILGNILRMSSCVATLPSALDSINR